MAEYPHFVPVLNPAPPPGYRLTQVLPLSGIEAVLNGKNATLEILREVAFEGEIVRSESSTLVLKNGSWSNDSAKTFKLDPVEGSNWAENGPIAYMQTSVRVHDALFLQLRGPGFYGLYSGPGRKSFLGDSSQKFAHPGVISQVSTYGKWAEGYPSCIVQPENDAGDSLLLINPYEKPAVVTLEIEGMEKRLKFRVQPFSGRRINVATLLEADMLPWQGEIYVTGPRRVVTSFIKHSLSDPTNIFTLEHTEAYRGGTAWGSFTDAYHWRYRSKFGTESPRKATGGG